MTSTLVSFSDTITYDFNTFMTQMETTLSNPGVSYKSFKITHFKEGYPRPITLEQNNMLFGCNDEVSIAARVKELATQCMAELEQSAKEGKISKEKLEEEREVYKKVGFPSHSKEFKSYLADIGADLNGYASLHVACEEQAPEPGMKIINITVGYVQRANPDKLFTAIYEVAKK